MENEALNRAAGRSGTVHIVDDDQTVRDSLRFLLEQEGLTVETYGSGPALLGADLPPAGCVLTDFHMPDMDGLQLQSCLADRRVPLPVIVMTGSGDVPAAVRAMKAGALDFIEKPFEDGQLLEAVLLALDCSSRAAAASSHSDESALRLEQLTAREREVLQHLVTGKSSKEIAKALGASPRTVDVHRGRVFHKLSVRTLPDLVHLVRAAEGPFSK